MSAASPSEHDFATAAVVCPAYRRGNIPGMSVVTSGRVYDLARWAETRERVLERDGDTCTVGFLFGGACTDDLHVHHLVAVSEGGDPFDDDNCRTSCSAHHPQWEAARRGILKARGRRTCTHDHRSRMARRMCERRLNRG